MRVRLDGSLLITMASRWLNRENCGTTTWALRCRLSLGPLPADKPFQPASHRRRAARVCLPDWANACSSSGRPRRRFRLLRASCVWAYASRALQCIASSIPTRATVASAAKERRPTPGSGPFILLRPQQTWRGLFSLKYLPAHLQPRAACPHLHTTYLAGCGHAALCPFGAQIAACLPA